MERVVRHPRELLRRGLEAQAEGARCRLTVRSDERAVHPAGLLAGDLLLEDRRDERLHDATRAGDVDAREPPGELGHEPMRGLHREQRGRVVGQAAQLRSPGDGPARTRPPGADDELATGIDHLDARRAVGRAGGAARAARLEPDRRVAVAVSEWRERPHSS
jgi:hypothetical protein